MLNVREQLLDSDFTTFSMKKHFVMLVGLLVRRYYPVTVFNRVKSVSVGIPLPPPSQKGPFHINVYTGYSFERNPETMF